MKRWVNKISRSLKYHHKLATNFELEETAEFLGKYYYSPTGTMGGNSIGSATFKELDENGQYVSNDVIYKALATHQEKYPDTIDITKCSKTGDILGFSNYIVEDLPVSPEKISFMFM